jgi:hypothetical protein
LRGSLGEARPNGGKGSEQKAAALKYCHRISG